MDRPENRQTVYIEEENQVRAEIFIDKGSTEVPEIPHGSLPQAVRGELNRLVTGIKRSGSRIIFSGIDSAMKDDTAENKKNVTEAYENMMQSRLSQSRLRIHNDFEKKAGAGPGDPYIRQAWNKVARSMLASIGVSGAANFQLFAVRLVDEPAHGAHIDEYGFGPSILACVLESDDPYRVCFARVKEGSRENVAGKDSEGV